MKLKKYYAENSVKQVVYKSKVKIGVTTGNYQWN